MAVNARVAAPMQTPYLKYLEVRSSYDWYGKYVNSKYCRSSQKNSPSNLPMITRTFSNWMLLFTREKGFLAIHKPFSHLCSRKSHLLWPVIWKGSKTLHWARWTKASQRQKSSHHPFHIIFIFFKNKRTYSQVKTDILIICKLFPPLHPNSKTTTLLKFSHPDQITGSWSPLVKVLFF